MKLSEPEREQIRQEQLVRMQLREETRLKRWPRLGLLTLMWAIALTVLAFASSHFHY
jgi:hypothetical protein